MAEAGARVLIADADENLRRRLYARLLDLEVFSDTVASGTHAIEKLEERPYGVVVVDFSLANAGSTTVLEHIRTMRERPLVIVTAVRDTARSLAADVVQIVLRKPFNVTHIAELIESCIRRARTGGRRRAGETRQGDEAR